jgi:hypothetical protein
MEILHPLPRDVKGKIETLEEKNHRLSSHLGNRHLGW